MINVKFESSCINNSPATREKIIKAFSSFLKQEKVFFKFIYFFKRKNGHCYETPSLVMQTYYNDLESKGKHRTLPSNPKKCNDLLILSQKWRIFLLDHFEEIFGELTPFQQRIIVANLFNKIYANRGRVPELSLSAMKNLHERQRHKEFCITKGLESIFTKMHK